MLGETFKLKIRLKDIETQLTSLNFVGIDTDKLFHQLGLLRQESMDIRRQIRYHQMCVFLLKLAILDGSVWELIELSKIKITSETDIDNQLFDNFFQK